MACRCTQQLGVGSCNAAGILSGQNVVASQMEWKYTADGNQLNSILSIGPNYLWECARGTGRAAGEYTGASNKRGPHEGPFPVESMMGDGDGDVAGCQALLALGTTTTTTTGYIPSAELFDRTVQVKVWPLGPALFTLLWIKTWPRFGPSSTEKRRAR